MGTYLLLIKQRDGPAWAALINVNSSEGFGAGGICSDFSFN